MRATLKVILLCLFVIATSSWGFYGHQKINRLAVFTLPPAMSGFYKKNIGYLTEAATHPDNRRYAVPGEALRHFIDIDAYGDSARFKLPKYWSQAVEKFGEDSLLRHGIVPWHIVRMFNQLKDAFLINDPKAILRCSAELGHYVADSNVPLHATHNYNGQLTGQNGIHALWESRLPELFFDQYDFFVGRAEYIIDPQAAAWNAVFQSSALVDSVLTEERLLTEASPVKFSYESKGKQTIRVYSVSFSRAYHTRLRGMVERRLRSSIKMVGDFWFTAWVDAGQPDLKNLMSYSPSEAELAARRDELKKWKEKTYKARDHEYDSAALESQGMR
ncbi:MAG TPA: zinc dependent phospholipase C family protein [Cyclobacteriaceae bacterium]|nr:zinc dependent phospholipase C family protein [Cyclobacteriaceae bacterium]